MKVLVIGSGGREHALTLALSKSPKVDSLFVLPGNGGMDAIATAVESISVKDHAAVVHFCKEQAIDYVVVGPEDPLVDGIVDSLSDAGIDAFGPSKTAAKLEGSKAFMKECAAKYDIPTAHFGSFTDPESAKNYIAEHGAPIVVKTDGLAAGKGVIIAFTEQEANDAVDEMFAGRFGDAGQKIVIEEFLAGEEASFFAICDGESAIAFGSAQDHKAVGEGDTGPNTGGMGTYSPAPVVNDAVHQKIMDRLVTPLIEGMKRDGIPYKGVLFVGAMIVEGEPKLLEYNVRFGDPECQVLMTRLESDLLPILQASTYSTLDQCDIRFSPKTALCVVMASNGYPGSYQKHTEIKAVADADAIENVTVYHAGTVLQEGKLRAVGGRVLGVTALESDVVAAQHLAYKAVDTIDWPEGFCRRDIGWRAIERIQKAG